MSLEIQKFWTNLELDRNPYSQLNAAKEDRLSEYFIAPPYFREVLGNSDEPTPSIVWAPRGSGKTAMRRMVETFVLKESPKILVVNYSDFWEPLDSSIDLEKTVVPLEYHLTNIIKRILLALSIRAIQKPKRNLSSNIQEKLIYLSEAYLTELKTNEIKSYVKSHQTKGQQINTWLDEWAKPIGSITLKYISAWKKGEYTEFDNTPEVNETPKRCPREDILDVRDICQELGYPTIYILVDSVDEHPSTDRNYKASANFIESMLRNLIFLEAKGFCYKFFLTADIKQHIEYRSDRIFERTVNWTERELIEMVSNRAKAYSKTKIDVAGRILGNEMWRRRLLAFSEGSPRDLLRIMTRCVEEATRRKPDALLITIKDRESAIREFCLTKYNEIAENTDIFRIRQGGHVEFIASTLAKNNDVTVETARSYIKEMEKRGVIKLISDPSAQTRRFAVRDIRIAYEALGSTVNLEVFFQKWVRFCKDNHHPILRNWDLSVKNPNCDRCGSDPKMTKVHKTRKKRASNKNK